jgi:crotonobetainyl-CoA:carnitine CoA-transferase CaiB-like acyl-CoA transferase
MLDKNQRRCRGKTLLESKKALAGVKVLEYASFVATPYCTKLLADLGAEVIKIEKPREGDGARRWGPSPDDMPHHEKSGLFLYLNTNKLGITLNLNTPTGHAIFERLVETTDILVKDNPPQVIRELRLSHQALN